MASATINRIVSLTNLISNVSYTVNGKSETVTVNTAQFSALGTDLDRRNLLISIINSHRNVSENLHGEDQFVTLVGVILVVNN